MVLHVAVFAVVVVGPLVRGLQRHEAWGDPNGGGPGSVLVNPVKTIPLPGRSGPMNPVANDTQSVVPAAPPKAREQRKARAEEPDAISLRGRNAKRRAAPESASVNKWRAQQKDLPNQMYSATGGALVSPMVGMQGGGGIGLGGASPFGRRFGNYASILRDAVARKWNTSDVDPRIRTAPQVIVDFTILRNGQVKNVRVAQRSGLALLDSSAERAIYDAAPFPSLPGEFEGSEANIEFVFQLSR